MNVAFHSALNEFDNPRLGRDNGSCRCEIAGVTQLVECDLAKVDVAGSNPVSRSILRGFKLLRSCQSLKSCFYKGCISLMMGVIREHFASFPRQC